jgi:hypothetical protein
VTPGRDDLAAERLVAWLESVEALDGPGRTVGRTVRSLIPRGAPKDVLSGASVGHAVHRS